jgi:hypothetical protein
MIEAVCNASNEKPCQLPLGLHAGTAHWLKNHYEPYPTYCFLNSHNGC